jgi:predicted nucleotidyltransferase
MAFDELLVTIQNHKDLLAEIGNLIVRKKNGDELDRGPAIAAINSFISEEMKRQSKMVIEKEIKPAYLRPLQDLFARLLDDVWNGHNKSLELTAEGLFGNWRLFAQDRQRLY